MSDTFWGGYSNGLNAINGVGQQVASRRAGARLRERDYSGAAGALYESGNLQGGMALQEQGDQRQAADSARQLAFTLQATRALKAAKDSGQDVLAAYDSYAPAFTQMGATPEQLQQFRVQLSTNPDGFLNSVEQIVGQQQRELTIRDGGAGDVVGIDPVTGEARLLYDAPDRPIATQFGILLPPGAAGANVPNARGEQPITGAAISNAPLSGGPAAVLPSSMVGITAQAESGNRDRDARGNLITSPAGAQGRMQVMPTTNVDPGYGVVPARDNSDAERTRVGEDYLAAMMREYGGDPAKAWAAYNWGPGNLNQALRRYGGDWLNYAPAETQDYVTNNLRALNGGQGGAPIEQGSEDGPAPTQDLGGGWSLQQMQTPADRRADQANARAEESAQRERARFEREQAGVRTLSPTEVQSLGLPEGAVAQRRADGSINVVSRGNSERFTEGQRLSAAFYHRALGAEQNIDRLSRLGNGRPSAAVLAFGEGRLRENALSPTDRQWVQASRDWLAPILRRDTGAAVSPGELVTYMGTYIPNPTDDAATLAQKAASRRRAQEGLRGTAGGAYDELLQTLGPAGSAPTAGGRRLRFQAAPAQLETSQRIVAARGNRPEPPRGDRLNPVLINPRDPTSSFANVPRGGYFITPDGQLRGPKP